jgi:coronin-1B/1C/6
MKQVRTSRYRHMYAEANATKLENLRLQTKGSENQNMAVNVNLMIALPWTSGGGGTVAVIDGKEFPSGRVGEGNVKWLTGHTGPITDLAWSPFDGQDMLFTGSEDATVRMYGGPEMEALGVLGGVHSRRVTSVTCSEVAKGMVASAAFDGSLVLWNAENSKSPVRAIATSTSAVSKVEGPSANYATSLIFGNSGNTVLATMASKGVVVFDPRSSGPIAAEIGICHDGPRGVRATWLGSNEDRFLLTAGTTTGAKREIKLWDFRKSEAAVQTVGLDDNAGTMFPVFDVSSNLIFLVGRGDGMVRIYEFSEGVVHPLTEYRTAMPQKAFVPFPRRLVDVTKNEVARFLKLETQAAQFVSFSVPRKSELVQGDLYPPCFTGEAAVSASDWFAGKITDGPLFKSLVNPNTHKFALSATVMSPALAGPTVVTSESDMRLRIAELEAENIRLKAALEAELTITRKLRSMLGN